MEEGKNILAFMLLMQALGGAYTIWLGARYSEENLKNFSLLLRLILGWLAILCFDFYITTKHTLELTVGRGTKEVLGTILLWTGFIGVFTSLFSKRIPARAVWILSGIIMLIWPLVIYALSRL